MHITFNVNNIQTPAEAEAMRRSQSLMKEIHNRARTLMENDNAPGFDANPADGFVEFKDPDNGIGKMLFDPATRDLKEMETCDEGTLVRFKKTGEASGAEELFYEMAQIDENSDPDATLTEKVQLNKGTGTLTYISNF
ncbi:MAG: hypothetical protein RDV48_29270 [Candidatus Eremiobacteraeota bacterium]|nr:hypothetical protein [Candidatus Eremiobacteraeota bacterium]